MPDAPTPLDLDAVEADLDARVPARDLGDRNPARTLIEEVKRLRADVALLRPALAQMEEAFDEESDAHDALKAEVARLTARPAPAWDEEAAALAVFERSHEPPFEDSEEGMREAKRFVRSLAVVRDHLPVKPGREAVLLTLARADGQEWESIADASLHTAEIMYGAQATAVLAVVRRNLERAERAEAEVARLRRDIDSSKQRYSRCDFTCSMGYCPHDH